MSKIIIKQKKIIAIKFLILPKYKFWLYNRYMKIKAFIVGEMVLALIIIILLGIFVIPAVSYNIQDRILHNQVRIIQDRFNKAMEDLAFDGEIGSYYENSASFANTLSEKIKILRFCPSTNLKDCFGYDKFQMPDGSYADLSDFKDGSVFSLNDGEEHDFSGDTIGFVTSEGVAMVLAYDKRCKNMQAGTYHLNIENNETSGARCAAVLLDVNRKGAPNKIYKDLSVINATRLNIK